MYVLVNCCKPLEVIGPFRTLKAAQTFRKENGESFATFAAISLYKPEIAKLSAKLDRERELSEV